MITTVKPLIYRWISSRYMAGCSNYNSLEIRKASRSKKQARQMFAAHNIPHATGEIFISPWRAHRFAREHGFPLCIKPNVSGFSRGSHFPIENFRQLWKAALLVKIWWPRSVVEQYLSGANYRVLCTPDSVVSVIRRYPPFVDGNGTDTISQLIDEENGTRRSMGLVPTIHEISKNSAVQKYLARQGLTLDSIPIAGLRVFLFNRVALAPGGVIETVDQSAIPGENLELCKKIVSLFDAKLFGIDVIFEKGIEHSYRDQDCIFLEVNSRPYTKMHHYPRYGQADDLSSFYQAMDSLQVEGSDTF